MMNFILGMGTMWILISVAFFLLDSFRLDLWESDRAYLKWLFFPIYLIVAFCKNWHGFIRIIKTLDLSFKYKINPFRTCISEIDEKFSDKDKEIFIKRIANDEQVERQWRKVLHFKTSLREKMQ